MASRLDTKHERILRALLKQADNRRCADCETLVSAARMGGERGAGCFFFRTGRPLSPPFLAAWRDRSLRGEKREGAPRREWRHKEGPPA